MAGGRNLMSKESPYIHSNYENFQAQYDWGAGYGGGIGKDGKNYSAEINEREKKINAILNSLEQKTTQFLGEKPANKIYSMKDFQGLTSNADSLELEFLEIVREYIQRDKFYNKVMKEIKLLFGEAIKKIFSNNEISNILRIDEKEIKKIINSNDFMTEFINTIQSKGFFELDLEQQIQIFYDGISFSNKNKNKPIKISLDKSALINESKEIFGVKINNQLKKGTKDIRTKFREALQQVSLDVDKTIGMILIQYLDENKNAIKTELQNNITINDKNFNKIFEKFIKKFRNQPALNQTLRDLSKTSVGALRGEEILATTLNNIGNGVVVTIGSEIEKNSRIVILRKLKKIIKSKNLNPEDYNLLKYSSKQLKEEAPSDLSKSIKGMDKQSRADLWIFNPKTNMGCGVQSKNYLQKYLYAKGGNNLRKISFLSPTEKENIYQFIDRVENIVGTDVNTDSLSYGLANTIWFLVAGSIPKKETKTIVRIEDPNLDIVMKELSIFLIGLLGIVYSQTLEENLINIDVLADISNLFYALDNTYMVPTFLIVKQLKEIIKNDTSEIKVSERFFNLSFKSAFTNISESSNDAIKLKEDKINAVSGKLNSHKFYSDSKLVEIGKEKGRNIVNATSDNELYRLKQIFMSFNYNNFSLSTYKP